MQAQSQLKALYKDNADTIIGNCDSSLFLGGKEETTLKSWNSLLGKETIDLYNESVTKGNQESHGQNFQKLGKDLMSMDEIAVMDGGKCLLQIRGVRPFLSDKYDITKHPYYKYLSDYDPKNAFNIEEFLSTRFKPKKDERFINSNGRYFYFKYILTHNFTQLQVNLQSLTKLNLNQTGGI